MIHIQSRKLAAAAGVVVLVLRGGSLSMISGVLKYLIYAFFAEPRKRIFSAPIMKHGGGCL